MTSTTATRRKCWIAETPRLVILAGVAAMAGESAYGQLGQLILYVDQAAPDGGDGSSWEHAFRDIHSASEAVRDATLVDAHDVVEIRIAKGVYRPDRGTGDRGRSFLIVTGNGPTRLFRLRGSFQGYGASDPDAQDFESSRTVLSGDLKNDDLPGFLNRSDNSFVVAEVGLQATTVLIEGIDVRGAFATIGESTSPKGRTGGLLVTVSSPVGAPDVLTSIERCRFEENQTDLSMGAGLSILAQSAAIINCEFRRNRAQRAPGGAVSLSVQFGYVTGIYSCEFESNSATHGGAIYQERSRLDVERCVFVGNSASVEGGAIAGIGARTAASLFVRNSAGSSGGAIGTSGYLGSKIGACTFVSNTAEVGAAINSYSSGLNVTQCVFADNLSAPAGIDVQCVDTAQPSKFSYNVFSGALSTIRIVGDNATYTNNVVNQNPQFIRPAVPADADSDWDKWNYRLRLNSKAIGIGGQWAGVDLDGRWRADGEPRPGDAGCYYYTYFTCPANISRNWNQIVDDEDFVLFLEAYTKQISPPANPDADLDRDGLVDDLDFSLFAAAYDRMICP